MKVTNVEVIPREETLVQQNFLTIDSIFNVIQEVKRGVRQLPFWKLEDPHIRTWFSDSATRES